MSLHRHSTVVTPAELDALANAVALLPDDGDIQGKETAYLWIASVREELYKEWEALDEGSHLKEAYRDSVWAWSDRDLAAMPEGLNVLPDDLTRPS